VAAGLLIAVVGAVAYATHRAAVGRAPAQQRSGGLHHAAHRVADGAVLSADCV